MNILSLSTFAERCGVATYNQALAGALRQAGASIRIHGVDVAAARKKSKREMLRYFDDVPGKLTACDAVLIQHEYGLFCGRHSSGLAQRVFARLMREVVRSRKPTAIIFHSEPRTSRRILSRRRFYWERIRALINANPQLFAVVHSAAAREQYVAAGLAPESIWTTRHPLPAARSIPRTGSDDTVTLTIFGFVSRYKGHDEAVAALDALPGRYRLLIAGGEHPGNIEDDTFRRLSTAGHPRVEITGWLETEEISRVMARTDIVLAPYHENGPAGSGAVTWGLCHGRPVIASDTVTFSEIQEEASCFALVPPRDAAALAAMVRNVAEDGALRAKLVERGLAYAREYSWPRMARGLLDRLAVSV